MSQTCYYHPAIPIVSTCMQCGIPLCGDCTNRIENVSACKQCAPSVQTRLQNAPAGSMYSSQAAPSNPQAPYGSPQADYGAPAIAQGSRYADVASSPGSIPLGLLLGSFIGVLGSILVMKILFYTGYGLSLLYIGVGYGIGFGIWSQARRGGVGLTLAAVGIMIVSLLIAHVVLAGDMLNDLRAKGQFVPAGITAFDVFPIVMKTMSPMHWVCILIGLAACWRGVESQSS